MYGRVKIFRFILIGLLMFYSCCMIITVAYGIYNLNLEEEHLDKVGYTSYDPSDYQMNRIVLVGIVIVTLITTAFGLIGSLLNSYCLLLFFGTSGVGMIILLDIILIVDLFVSFAVGSFLVIVGLTICYVSLSLAQQVNIYKKYLSTRSPLDLAINSF